MESLFELLTRPVLLLPSPLLILLSLCHFISSLEDIYFENLRMYLRAYVLIVIYVFIVCSYICMHIYMYIYICYSSEIFLYDVNLNGFYCSKYWPDIRVIFFHFLCISLNIFSFFFLSDQTKSHLRGPVFIFAISLLGNYFSINVYTYIFFLFCIEYVEYIFSVLSFRFSNLFFCSPTSSLPPLFLYHSLSLSLSVFLSFHLKCVYRSKKFANDI